MDGEVVIAAGSVYLCVKECSDDSPRQTMGNEEVLAQRMGLMISRYAYDL